MRGVRAVFCILGGLLLSSQVSFASEKDYYESIINLQAIEKFFVGQPIYLSKDEKLKSNLKIKLQRIIDNLEDYKSINSKPPDDYRIRFFLGKANSFAHDLDVPGAWSKSVQYFDEALKLNPDSVEVMLIQAKNFMDAERVDDALALYVKADQLEPKGYAKKLLAFALMQQKKNAEAITAIEGYIENHPEDKDAPKILNALENNRLS